jgi:hypothetical protein
MYINEHQINRTKSAWPAEINNLPLSKNPNLVHCITFGGVNSYKVLVTIIRNEIHRSNTLGKWNKNRILMKWIHCIIKEKYNKEITDTPFEEISSKRYYPLIVKWYRTIITEVSLVQKTPFTSGEKHLLHLAKVSHKPTSYRKSDTFYHWPGQM